MTPSITLIVAMTRNHVIGRNNQLPWHLPADLSYFKQQTLNQTVVMGRKTFESIGRALPQRKNIILTNTQTKPIPDVTLASNWPELLKIAGHKTELIVIGGAQMFKLALPHANCLKITWVENPYEGDVYFPEIQFNQWELVSQKHCPSDAKNASPLTFEVWQRLSVSS
jgi:dihydrofolate reductase